MDVLEDISIGTLLGAAVGDALGGATEGWLPEQIIARYGGPVTGIVPPYFDNWRDARPIAPYHKGDGHVTDDTLMTHALVEVYDKRRDHLDTYAIAEDLVPLLIADRRWIPELEADALLLQRIFLAEKHLVARIYYGHVDPREAGVGNIVNCGAAMYVAPVGIANAGDPDGAYAEAIDIAGAHQSSYGREAAGVFAAAVAAAAAPGADAASVVDACLRLAKDGTRAAVSAVAEAAIGQTDCLVAIPALRAAVAPYDSVGTRLPRAAAGRPTTESDPVDRGTPGGPRHGAGRGRRLPFGRSGCGQLRPGRGLDRVDDRGDHRCARGPALRCRRSGRIRSPRRPGSISCPRP